MHQSEAELWARIFRVDGPGSSPDHARWILTISFGEKDRVRIQLLLDLANQGTISPQQLTERDSYIRVSDLLNILQAKARLLLKSHDEKA